MNIDSERELLDVRADLKNFKKIEPKKVLQILKSIKECSGINKEWIRKTKITKTLVRISMHKYLNQDDIRIMVGKLAKALVAKFKSFFPKLAAINTSLPTHPPAETATQQHQSLSKPVPQQQQQQSQQQQQQQQIKPVSQEAKKSESTESGKTDVSQNKDLPNYQNDRRNQGLQGILKYFQKGFDESKMSMSTRICIEIENFLSQRSTQGDSFNEVKYKDDVKKLCKQFIDKDNSTKQKNAIYEEFIVKQTGQLDSIKEILK